MSKASVKSDAVERYNGLSLAKLEEIISNLQAQQKSHPASTTNRELSAARYALQQRQHKIKAKVMEFEQSNNRHLLFFNSTNAFVKIAGHSAIFFAVTIADRIHWRYSLKVDTDRYSTSEDGVISFRSLSVITDRLAEINIFPDPILNNTDEELHYFLLPKVYNDEQIAKLRDNIQRDLKRIMSIVLPTSPIPTLYDAIMQVSQLLYFQFKHLSDGFARETIGQQMIELTYKMSQEYLRFARNKTPNNPKELIKIIEYSQEIRFGIAYLSKLQILHHRDICQILEQLIAIERISTKAYLRASGKQTNV